MKKFFLSLLAALVVLICVLLFNTFNFKSKQINSGAKPVALPVDADAVQHLSRAISIATISYDDSLTMLKTTQFDSFLVFLKTTYPLVFSSLQDTVLNGKNLLFKWAGSDDKLAPVMLYAHMDVVPVEDNTLGQWKHAPFSGDVADGFIWGRGALDDKGSLISIFEALNKLLEKGFKPQRTIYIASGADEEIGGNNGAEVIAQYCKRNSLHFGMYMDEGGMVSEGVVPNMKTPVALIGTAEKGYLTLELVVNTNGGHSSRPAKETSLDILVSAVKKIHDHPFDKHASQPVDEFIDYVGPEIPMPLKMVFANKWLFRPVILSQYTKSDAGNAMVRTTGVVTVMNAGVKENVVPSKVSAKVNFRILPGQTSKEVQDIVKTIINDNRVTLIPGELTEPSQSSSADSWGFKLIQKSASAVFPDAYVSPFLMIGSTDSKHFTGLADETYRFFPTRMDDEAVATIHGINERIKISSYMETIQFYQQLISDAQTFSIESKK